MITMPSTRSTTRSMRFLLAFAVASTLTLIGTAGVAQEATPALRTALGTAPDPALCRIEPRPVEELLTLIATPVAPVASPPTVTGSPTPTMSPDGEPADATTVAAVSETVVEIFACENAGDLPRGFALLSEEYIARSAASAPLPPEFEDLLAADPVSLEPEQRTVILDLRDIVVLPDERVGATLHILRPITEDAEPDTAEIVFVLVDDRYLFDSIEDVGAGDD